MASPVAAAVVGTGSVIFPSRAALTDAFTPEAEQVRAARAVSPAEVSAAEATRLVTDHLIHPRTEPLREQDLVLLGSALTAPGVRDQWTLLTVDHTSSAQVLWWELARRLPDPVRADAAVLLAIACHLDGQRVLAAEAVRQALRAEPGHRLAHLLDRLLAALMSPAQLRAVLTDLE